MNDTIQIDHLGIKADGIGRDSIGTTVYVPFTLPGERVRVARDGARGQLQEVLQASAERREAPCPHYGACGGCDLQHVSDTFYRDFKRDTVVEAFRRVGLEPNVEPLVGCAPATRRRAVFSATRAGPRVLLGFHAALSQRIVALQRCLVVLPEIEAALPMLRRIAERVVPRKGEARLTVTSSGTGLDIAIEGGAPANERLRRDLVTEALGSGLARLSLGGEILVEAGKPMILAGDIPIALPPGAFVQAVASAEAEMARHALDHFGGLKAVADLFCGVGTFSFRLARRHATHAVESDAAALSVLQAATRSASGLKPLTVERRDLFRRPVTAKELGRFDGVLFDPPRAGAEAQCRQLAESTVRRVAAVSCNPLTLARDARILVDGGYELLSVTPIDQFLWSHHVEAVALFARRG
ncbi:class I SAM-dependent RNA methyltransferase [Aureimonas frigidaquae]|uniref:class I SAM-dependent RNA methyltransferase n=1 Tax=Aureimonas frigidaquae TaxID=424757 RepID=UPI0007859826|nr:class I SAM-dependent RNA methyltransferase [Aureimonas frigidaquae]